MYSSHLLLLHACIPNLLHTHQHACTLPIRVLYLSRLHIIPMPNYPIYLYLCCTHACPPYLHALMPIPVLYFSLYVYAYIPTYLHAFDLYAYVYLLSNPHPYIYPLLPHFSLSTYLCTSRTYVPTYILVCILSA